VTVLAISMDTPEDSRAFARNYGLQFPLLSDADGAVSKIYAGVTSDSNALPGVTIIRSDGRVVFRQVASAKDDRMSTGELIATVDRTLGTSGPAAGGDGFAALDRLQLRADAGGGAVRTTGWSGTGVGAISGLVPLGHHLLAGVRASFEPREAPVALDAALVARLPIWGVAGAIELGAFGGWTVAGASGANAGGMADLWFAFSPRWAVQLGASYVAHDLGGSTVHEVLATFGVSRLIQIR
jgi:hypothetical protein